MPHRRALPFAALLAGAALLASSCSLADLGGQNADRPAGDGGAAPATREPRAAKRRPGPAWATGAPVRVVMNDRFRYRPAAIMVRAGGRGPRDGPYPGGALPRPLALVWPPPP